MDEGIDLAHTLLHALRFNFPRIVMGIAFFRGDPSLDATESICDLLRTHSGELFPSSGIANISSHTVTNCFRSDEWVSYGQFEVCESYIPEKTYSRNVHLDLMKTIAAYAGQTLEIPSVLSDEYGIPFSAEGKCPDLDVDPETRWYWHLWDQGHFKSLDIDVENVIGLSVCDSVLGESWKLLKAMMSSNATLPSPIPLDEEEQEIVNLITSIGHRLTTTQILAEFEKAGIPKAESTIKGKLGRLVKSGLLSNRQDIRPHKGYGLPDWQ